MLNLDWVSYKQACDDIDYYFSKLDSIHPNIYWHTPKARVDSFVMALKKKLPGEVDVSQLGYELKLSDCFWDYHTSIYFTVGDDEKIFPTTDLRSEGLFLKNKKMPFREMFLFIRATQPAPQVHGWERC